MIPRPSLSFRGHLWRLVSAARSGPPQECAFSIAANPAGARDPGSFPPENRHASCSIARRGARYAWSIVAQCSDRRGFGLGRAAVIRPDHRAARPARGRPFRRRGGASTPCWHRSRCIRTPLLVQILMASTYPLQVVRGVPLAGRGRATAPYSGRCADPGAGRGQAWDPSVKSLVPFPQVLAMLNSQLEWMQQLGWAFAGQQADVMAAIQRLRHQAQANGSLQSTQQQRVTEADGTIAIEPASPQIVYVPVYVPQDVYGAWPSPAYPPVYIPPPADYTLDTALYGGLGFATGVVVVGSLFGFARPRWHHREVHIDVDRFNRINVNRAAMQSPLWHPPPAAVQRMAVVPATIRPNMMAPPVQFARPVPPVVMPRVVPWARPTQPFYHPPVFQAYRPIQPAFRPPSSCSGRSRCTNGAASCSGTADHPPRPPGPALLCPAAQRENEPHADWSDRLRHPNPAGAPHQQVAQVPPMMCCLPGSPTWISASRRPSPRPWPGWRADQEYGYAARDGALAAAFARRMQRRFGWEADPADAHPDRRPGAGQLFLGHGLQRAGRCRCAAVCRGNRRSCARSRTPAAG